MHTEWSDKDKVTHRDFYTGGRQVKKDKVKPVKAGQTITAVATGHRDEKHNKTDIGNYKLTAGNHLPQ